MENQLKPIIVKGRLTHIKDHPISMQNELISKFKHSNIFSGALKNYTHVKCNYLNCLKTKMWSGKRQMYMENKFAEYSLNNELDVITCR